MFVLPSISGGLEFWSINHTSIYEDSQLNVFKSINLLGGTSNKTKWFIRNKYIKTLESGW